MAIGLIASVIGIALGLLIDWFPTQATEEGKQIDTLWDVLIICSVPVFVLVMVVVLYCVWEFRMRPGDELRDGPPIHGNTRLEIIWTAIPAIVLVALCSYAYVVLRDVEEADANALDVRVVGQQFTWTFYYQDPAGKTVASPQLYVPTGRQVKFTVQSDDVIHDFWVPAFRLKIDAVPGHQHVAARDAREGRRVPGRLRGAVRASATPRCARPPTWSSRPEFDRWLAERARRRAEGRRPDEASGEPPRPTASRCSPTRAAAAATRWPTPARPAAPGPTSTRCSPDKNAAVHRAEHRRPRRRDRAGLLAGIMPGQFGQTLQPAELDALVKYLDEVAGK